MLLSPHKLFFSFDLAHLRAVLSRNTTTNNILDKCCCQIGDYSPQLLTLWSICISEVQVLQYLSASRWHSYIIRFIKHLEKTIQTSLPLLLA